MKDFLFSTEEFAAAALKEKSADSEIFAGETVRQFEGEWGTLLVTEDCYTQFQPYEDGKHLFIVLGGPLYTGPGTEDFLSAVPRLMSDWQAIDFSQHFDGPFALLKVDKEEKRMDCVTDLLSFIPVYRAEQEGHLLLSSHVDLLADAAGEREKRDAVSELDFILHGAVTYPYTAYENIRQVSPGTIHTIDKNTADISGRTWWLPEEILRYTSIEEAADDLRNTVETYVNRVTEKESSVAHFISGGEDSRTIAGLIPDHLHKDSFVFLDDLNLEGKIAKKSAAIYGSNFHFYARDPLHYLYILPGSSELVGSGSEYKHAHTYGFHEKAGLNKYPVVLGGLFSDALLKGARIRKIRGSGKFPFLPDIKDSFYTVNKEASADIFRDEVMKTLRQRREDHYHTIKGMRPESAKEWFQMWPASMNMNIPNLHVNRRLFCSYEPFMANGVVKISASVPQSWKMNRKLFHRAFKSYLKPAWWLWHSDGRFPYFSRYANIMPQLFVWMYMNLAVKTGRIKGHQGPFAHWDTIFSSEAFRQTKEEYLNYGGVLPQALKSNHPFSSIFESDQLEPQQKINLLQVLHHHKTDG
ncbi:asparagine synthase-related protein [Salimicrobium salexigens]|uniref:asparagine synthase (glutamine-hydrolyzing) n=1 Tax=Salimicrobium salexigens TaxID=908941 RepID=A0ABY1KYQ9_9BACI|nr:asparagine synthase-related protein [Salimicrobium salexigens]SIS94716.1 Asparagine synthase [Salimicrobium salexigens]